MTDTYVQELLIETFKNLEQIKKEAKYEVATIYSNDTTYYTKVDETYSESDPQPESQTDIDSGNYYEITDYPTIAFPNEAFTRPKDGYWYELWPIPAQPIQIELGQEADSRWIGIFQVNICVPNNCGIKPINERFNYIEQFFHRGLVLKNGIRIDRTYRTASIDDGDYNITPVTIEWQADLEPSF